MNEQIVWISIINLKHGFIDQHNYGLCKYAYYGKKTTTGFKIQWIKMDLKI